MAGKKVNSKNFKKVLTNLSNLFDKEDKSGKQYLCDSLNYILDELRDEDFFGTEGQTDPRGDNRD